MGSGSSPSSSGNLGRSGRRVVVSQVGLITSAGTHGSSKGIPVGILTSIKPMSHRYL